MIRSSELKNKLRVPRTLLIALSLSVILVVSVGVIFYQSQYNQIKNDVVVQLQTESNFKINQIVYWRKERIADAYSFSSSTFFEETVSSWEESKDVATESNIRSRFSVLLKSSSQYADIYLTDSKGNILIDLYPKDTKVISTVLSAINESIDKDIPVFTDLYKNKDGAIRMELVAPLVAKDKVKTGAVVLVIDPDLYLYPLIKSWPTESSTAETLLVKQEGNYIVWLNNVRFNPTSALVLTATLTSSDNLLATQVLRGVRGVVTGTDYRQMKVIAALDEVPDTDWKIIVKEDESELLKIFYPVLLLTSVCTISLIATLISMVFVLWKNIQQKYYYDYYTAETKYKQMFFEMPTGVSIHKLIYDDVTGRAVDYRFLDINPAFEKMTDFVKEKTVGKTLTQLLPGVDTVWLSRYAEVVKTGEPIKINDYVKELGRYYEIRAYKSGPDEFVTLVLDVTAQTELEIKKNLLNRSLVISNACNQALAYSKSKYELLQKICDIAVTLGGYKLARVGQVLSDKNKSVTPVAVAGNSGDYLDKARISWDSNDRGKGPTGKAARLKEIIVNQDTRYIQDYTWKEDALALGFNSSVAIPLMDKQTDSTASGVLTLYSDKVNNFTKEELDLLESLAGDIAFGYKTLDLKEENQKADELIREQKEELAAQNEELAAQNEELASQGKEIALAEEKLRTLNSELEQRIKERTEELIVANAALAKAARMKDEFLASMSHELRTPLTGILGVSELLEIGVYGTLIDKQVDALRLVQSSGKHLLSLITDILDLSKIGAGMAELSIDTINIDDLCGSCTQMVKPMADGKSITVKYSRDERATEMRGDLRRMKQILVNLLGNAVKFTKDRGEVGINVSCTDSNVQFEVWDKGIGIAEEDLNKLFKPFVQIDSRLDRQYSGTGLGLALVASLTELHGGQVTVKSSLGNGSIFTVIMPWNKPVSIKNKTKIKQALVVDDSDVQLTLITRILNEMGINVVTDKTGKDTVSKAIAISPDVVILDIILPEGSGWHLLKELKNNESTKDIPVIVMSSFTKPPAYADSLAVAYLEKPVTRQDVARALELVDTSIKSTAFLVSGLASNVSVLIVDDNDTIVSFLSAFFLSKDFTVFIAKNGKEGVEVARKEKPSVILMDVQMPGMSGMEAARIIMADKDKDVASIPIVAVTALAMPGDKEKFMETGIAGYIEKPLKLNLVLETVVNLITNKKEDRLTTKSSKSNLV